MLSERSEEKTEKSKEKIAIIGAGAAGGMIALKLAKAGFAPILIEKNKKPFTGTTNSTPGRPQLGFHYIDPETAKMCLRGTIKLIRAYSQHIKGEKSVYLAVKPSSIDVNSAKQVLQDTIKHIRRYPKLTQSERDKYFDKKHPSQFKKALYEEYSRLIKEDRDNEVLGPLHEYSEKLKLDNYDIDAAKKHLQNAISNIREFPKFAKAEWNQYLAKTHDPYLHKDIIEEYQLLISRDPNNQVLGKPLEFFVSLYNNRTRSEANMGSLFALRDIFNVHTILINEYQRLINEDRENEVLGSARDFSVILDPKNYQSEVDMRRVEMGFEVAERSIDWPALQKDLTDEIESNENITFLNNTEVISIDLGEKSRYKIEIKQADNSIKIDVDYVFNASWENIEWLNRNLFPMKSNEVTKRPKVIGKFKCNPTNGEEKIFSRALSYVNGPHAALTPEENNTAFVTYEPVTNLRDHEDRDQQTTDYKLSEFSERLLSGGATEEEKQYYGKKIIQGACGYFPFLKDAQLLELRFGVVKTYGGLVDIYDPQSPHHKRTLDGIDILEIGFMNTPAPKLSLMVEVAERALESFLHQLSATKIIDQAVEKSEEISKYKMRQGLDLSWIVRRALYRSSEKLFTQWTREEQKTTDPTPNSSTVNEQTTHKSNSAKMMEDLIDTIDTKFVISKELMKLANNRRTKKPLPPYVIILNKLRMEKLAQKQQLSPLNEKKVKRAETVEKAEKIEEEELKEVKQSSQPIRITKAKASRRLKFDRRQRADSASSSDYSPGSPTPTGKYRDDSPAPGSLSSLRKGHSRTHSGDSKRNSFSSQSTGSKQTSPVTSPIPSTGSPLPPDFLLRPSSPPPAYESQFPSSPRTPFSMEPSKRANSTPPPESNQHQRPPLPKSSSSPFWNSRHCSTAKQTEIAKKQAEAAEIARKQAEDAEVAKKQAETRIKWAKTAEQLYALDRHKHCAQAKWQLPAPFNLQNSNLSHESTDKQISLTVIYGPGK